MNKRIIALAFAGGAVVAAGVSSLWPHNAEEPTAAALMDAVMWNKGPIGGPFALTDHNGKPRSDADFRGQLMLIYFGYTYCSDICPIDLQTMATAIDKLGPAGDAVQPLFITIDPEHDTPEQIKLYVTLYHPRFVGLTGSVQQIKKIALAYKVYYAKSEPARKNDRAIDHTGFVFLVGRDGKYLGFLPPGTSAERMIEAIQPNLAIAQR